MVGGRAGGQENEREDYWDLITHLHPLTLSLQLPHTLTLHPLIGAGESTAVLVVEDPLFGSGVDRAPPTISSPTPSSQSIPEGLTAQFVCVAFGFPQPTIQWLRNGQVRAAHCK